MRRRTDWGVVPFDRVGLEFRLVGIPANQETGNALASGWTEFDNWDADKLTEQGVRNLLVLLGIKRDEVEVFMGEDLI
jgi:hypothetical protein